MTAKKEYYKGFIIKEDLKNGGFVGKKGNKWLTCASTIDDVKFRLDQIVNNRKELNYCPL